MSVNRMRLWGMAVVLSALAALVCAGPATAASGISGHVIDTAGNPLQGIEVCAESPGYVGPSGGCAWTDSNGGYSIPGGVPGDIVHFHSTQNLNPDLAPQWWPNVPFSDEAQRVTEADAGHIDAAMGPGGTVTGQIVSRATSLPIEGVEVCPASVVFRDGETTYCAHSDAEGRFTLQGLSEEEYRFQFYTEGDVNFVEAGLGPIAIHAGGTVDVEASLVPGFEIAGTVTEAGTGAPVGEAIPLPHPGTMVCAVDAATEARVKCAGVGVDGRYSIPGIPPGRTVGVTFGVDSVEDGVDVAPDGYVRRYWDEVPNWSEAAFISGTGGSVFGNVNAALTQGEEVFPNCEVASACASSSSTTVIPPAIPTAPVISEPNSYVAHHPDPATVPARRAAVHCKVGFRRGVGSPSKQCVEIRKKHRPGKHRRPAHPRRHNSAPRLAPTSPTPTAMSAGRRGSSQTTTTSSPNGSAPSTTAPTCASMTAPARSASS